MTSVERDVQAIAPPWTHAQRELERSADEALRALAGLRRRQWAIFAALVVLLAVTFVIGIAVGSVRIPLAEVVTVLGGGEAERASHEVIIREVRLPRSITAVLAGAALGLAGLQMQTLFRNPLADPFVLGISAGASLGVALVVLAAGTGGSVFAAGFDDLGNVSLALAAILGSAAVLLIVLAFASRIRNPVTVLLIGLMVGQLSFAVVTVLLSAADERQVQQFVAWGFGSFRGVTWDELRILAPITLGGLLLAATMSKQLNALLLGEPYARSMGVHILRTRIAIIASASVLAGTVTAFAGPIGFLGLAIPHVARAILRTADHRVLVPAVVLLGGTIALLAEVVAQLPGSNAVLPLNAVTAAIGAPIVIVVLLRSRDGMPAS